MKQTIKLPPREGHADGETVELQEGELVNFEYSYKVCSLFELRFRQLYSRYIQKYSDADAISLFAAANLRVMRRWRDKKGLYSLWLLERAQFTFPVPSTVQSLTTSDIPTNISNTAASTSSKSKLPFPSVPTRGEWEELWKVSFLCN